ncbi:MAG: nucleotidyltransferase domain-containing protein [Thermodesulfovibrionales bacterium]
MDDFKTYSLTPKEKKEIRSIIKAELQKDERIVFAYIYGSFVDPEMPFFRDIDIGVYVSNYRNEEWDRYELSLPLELEKALNYRYPIDVKVLNNAEVIFSYRVISGRLLFLRDEDLWTDYVVYISKRYADFYPFWLHYMKEDVLSE